MMKKLFLTFLICYCWMFDALAQIQPNKPTCLIPSDRNVYQTIYNVANPRLFKLEVVADVQPSGGFPCTESGQMTWVLNGTCRVRNSSGSTYINGEYGTYQLLDCPIDDYILPMAILVIGFSYHRLHKKLTVV